MVPKVPLTTNSVDASELMPPSTADAIEPVPPSTVEDAKPEEFGGDPVELSLLPQYTNHIARHIWDIEV